MLPAPALDVRDWMVGSERDLFFGQSLVDQRHAMRVAHLLLSQGHSDSLLLRAALLHDVGKSVGTISLVARVTWVLAGRLSPRLRGRLPRVDGWRALADHPSVGAHRLQASGADPRLVALVAGRALPGDEFRQMLLQAADDAV